MKNLLFLLLIICMSGISSCKKNPEPVDNTNDGLKGPYLGLVTPGTTPTRFAPGPDYLANSSWSWQSSPAFSPNGEEMYFTKRFTNNGSEQIWFTKIVNGKWSVPARASFSKTDMDKETMFLANNDTLYFGASLYSTSATINKVGRTATGWGEPKVINVPIPSGYILSGYAIINSKDIYLTLSRNLLPDYTATFRTSDIYVSRLISGKYTQAVNLGIPINSDVSDDIGYIDPNERFMIINSKRVGAFGEHDIYISYRNVDGTWKTPVKLENNISTAGEEMGALMTPDGKYMFFSTQRSGDLDYSPYWFDAKLLDSYK